MEDAEEDAREREKIAIRKLKNFRREYKWMGAGKKSVLTSCHSESVEA